MPSPRRGAGRGHGRRMLVELQRRADLPNDAGGRVHRLDDHPPVPELRIVDRLAEVVDRADAGIRPLEGGKPRIARPAAEDLAPDGERLRIELRRDEIRPGDSRAQSLEELGLERADRQVLPVGAGVDVVTG